MPSRRSGDAPSIPYPSAHCDRVNPGNFADGIKSFEDKVYNSKVSKYSSLHNLPHIQ